MAGFENDVVVGKNLNFDDDGPKPHLGILNAAGKLPIGTGNLSPTPEVLGGSLTSPNNSITFGYSSPNITAVVNTNVVPDLHTAKWIVNPTPNMGGNSTTIQNAINNAVAGETVFIMAQATPFTENLALKAGVNLAAFGCDAQNNVTIKGKMTYSSAGMVSISGIFFETNSDFILVVSGSAASVVVFNNCRFNLTNNTAFSFTSSSASSRIFLFRSTGDTATTGITYVASSAAGQFGINYCVLSNTGASTTASTVSAGSINANYSVIQVPITTSGTGSLNCTYCTLDSGATNTTAVTVGSGTGASLESCRLGGGTASAASIAGSATITNSTVSSSNTNILTGAGTLNYVAVDTSSTGQKINVTTQSYLASGTFTPTLTGAAVAGTTTYTTQLGNWSKVGNIVHVDINLAGTAATGTGDATIGGLPFTVSVASKGSLQWSSTWAWPAATTMLIPRAIAATTNITVFGVGTGATGGLLQMTNAAFNVQLSIDYQV